MKKKKLKIASIKWKTKEVSIGDILPSPKNYKIKSDIGRERLQVSLSDYGLAGSVVANPNGKGKYVLIDGNSRLQEAKDNKEKTLSVSYPNKPLTTKQFTEMCKIFDLAKAGEVDIKTIEAEGTTADFFKKYNLEIPMHLLNRMGAKVNVKELEFPEKKGKGGKITVPVNDIQMVQLFFNGKQHEEFRKIEAILQKRYKVVTTHETVLKAFKALIK